MNKLTTEVFKFESLYDHISEFVRIDEHLRMKQMHLESITPESRGWTYISGQEINKHKRIVKNIRCFLHYHAREFYGMDAKILSQNEYLNLKTQKETNYQIYQNLTDFDSICNDDQFWFFMRALSDTDATVEFYKILLETIYQTKIEVNGIEKKELIQNLLKKCVFTLP